MTCNRFAHMVMTLEDWEAKHKPHLQGKEFTQERYDHPSGEWFWHICPCGAKHLVMPKE